LGLLLVRYILFVRGETPADIGFRPGLRPVLESVPLVGVAYAGALLTVLALHGSVMAEAATQRARTAFMTSSAPLTFVYVIVGPLFEETIVRAYLMTRRPGGCYRGTCPANPGPSSPASYSVTRRPSRSWA